MMKRRTSGESSGSPAGDSEKQGEHAQRIEHSDNEAGLGDSNHDLTRGLKARHITMIAIGGAVGTGLIIGT